MSKAVPPPHSRSQAAAEPLKRHPIYAVDRRHRILERVAAEQTIHVGELARELRVSEMTIRRDIRRLERDGFLRQTYGGATAHITRSFDVAFNARALQHTREKRLIGMRATRLIEDARTAFVGIGTTAEQFARYLSPRDELTVVTASLPIASLLGTRPFQVVVLGGTVLHDELSCVGPAAVRTLERYRFDVAVIGAATNAVVAPVDRISVLVTDQSADPAEVATLKSAGVDVVFASAERASEGRARNDADRSRPAMVAAAPAG